MMYFHSDGNAQMFVNNGQRYWNPMTATHCIGIEMLKFNTLHTHTATMISLFALQELFFQYG